MLLHKWEAKIRLKEKSPQPGIELATTRSWVRHAHHWAICPGRALFLNNAGLYDWGSAGYAVSRCIKQWRLIIWLHPNFTSLVLTLSQMTNFRLFQTERLCRQRFQLWWNDSKFSKRVENTVGKGEIARYELFLLFLQCFQKTWTADT